MGKRKWEINKTLGINSIKIFYQNRFLENMTNTKHESMNYSRDGANKREPNNKDSRPNKRDRANEYKLKYMEDV